MEAGRPGLAWPTSQMAQAQLQPVTIAELPRTPREAVLPFSQRLSTPQSMVRGPFFGGHACQGCLR